MNGLFINEYVMLIFGCPFSKGTFVKLSLLITCRAVLRVDDKNSIKEKLLIGDYVKYMVIKMAALVMSSHLLFVKDK